MKQADPEHIQIVKALFDHAIVDQFTIYNVGIGFTVFEFKAWMIFVHADDSCWVHPGITFTNHDDYMNYRAPSVEVVKLNPEYNTRYVYFIPQSEWKAVTNNSNDGRNGYNYAECTTLILD